MAEEIKKRSTFSIKVTFNQYNDPEQEANICVDEDCQNPSKSNTTTTNATWSYNSQMAGNKQQQASGQSCCCVSQRESNNEDISHRCNITLHRNQLQQVYCCDHFKNCLANQDNDYEPSSRNNKPKQFRYIQPQNHKSSLFVNLSQNSSKENNNLESKEDNHRRRDNLFISPDLDINLKKYSTVLSTAPISPNSTIDSSSCIYDHEDNNILYDKLNQRDMFSCLYANTSSSQTDLTEEKEFEEDSASRRESFLQIEYSDIDSDMEQLTKSTDTTSNPLTISDAHDDEYFTNGTVTMEQHQNRELNIKSPITFTQPQKDLNICNIKDQKLILTELDLDELNATPTDEDWTNFLSMNPEEIAELIKSIHEQIDICESDIAKLERKRRVGSETLITKIIEKRRNIRDLQMQAYERKLNEKLLFSSDQNLSSPTDLKHFDDNCKKMEANKLTSQLRQQTTTTARSSTPDTMTNTTCSTTNNPQITLSPGIEDTAHILNAVPPTPEY